MQFIQFEFDGPRTMVVPDGSMALACAMEIINGHCYPFPKEAEPDVKCVVDLGAHAGEFTTMAALRWPQAKLYAYEPNKEVATLCVWNLDETKHPDWKVIAKAVDEKGGKGKLYFSEYGSVAYSLFPGQDREGRQATAGMSVTVAPASEIAKLKPDVLKLDIEGAEERVLWAMKPSLHTIRRIYVEFHGESLRLSIEKLLIPTHRLAYARIVSADQGELMYLRR